VKLGIGILRPRQIQVFFKIHSEYYLLLKLLLFLIQQASKFLGITSNFIPADLECLETEQFYVF